MKQKPEGKGKKRKTKIKQTCTCAAASQDDRSKMIDLLQRTYHTGEPHMDDMIPVGIYLIYEYFKEN